MTKHFAVKTSTLCFSLMEAFVKECEKHGIKYNHDFTKFDPSYLNYPNKALYFATEWNDVPKGPSCSLTHVGNDDIPCFYLEKSWEEAIAYMKEWKKHIDETSVFKLTNDYNVVINKNRTVTVGCQIIHFDRIYDLVNLMKKHEPGIL